MKASSRLKTHSSVDYGAFGAVMNPANGVTADGVMSTPSRQQLLGPSTFPSLDYEAGGNATRVVDYGAPKGKVSSDLERARAVAIAQRDAAEQARLAARQPKPPMPWFGWLMFFGCLAGFAYELYVGRGIAPLNENPMVGPTAAALEASGAKVASLIEPPNNQWWRLIAPMWLHAGVIHLVSNMAVLLRFGFQLETTCGTARFATLYFLSGVLSMVYSCIFAPNNVTVGASGALFGVFGAFLAELGQNIHMIPTWRERFWSFGTLIFSILLNLAIGLLPMIDNFCHIFGMIGGLCLGSALLIYIKEDEDASCRQQTFAVLGVVAYLFLLIAGICLVYFKVNANSFCPWCEYMSCVPSPWWTCNPPAASTGNLTSLHLL